MDNTLKYDALKLKAETTQAVSDTLTVEHPLSVSINGEAFTLTMQSPGNEQELVRGLLFTEGIYKKKNTALDIQVTETSEQGFVSKVNVVVDEKELDHSQLNKRNLLSVASCGICGKTELALPAGEQLHVNTSTLALQDLQAMFEEMQKVQTAFLTSGGCHAASAFSKDKKMMTMQEDIGRHNAVDKVIGALLMKNELSDAQYLLVSGRVSYEIVSKCFIAGIPFLLAVSAPSSLAVDFSKELGITLLGFCREDRATVYSHHERMMQ